MTRQICKYLPTWYKPVEEYQQICQTETAQLEALAAAIHAVKENFYFQTMNLAGVEMWEDVLRIIPNPSTEDLDFRRARGAQPDYHQAALHPGLSVSEAWTS